MADFAIIVQAASDLNLRNFLISFFSECGNITSLAIVPDKVDFTRNLAVVQFAHTRSVEIAVSLDQSIYAGRPVVINRARPNFVCPPRSGVFPVKDNVESLTLEDVIGALVALNYELAPQLIEKHYPAGLPSGSTSVATPTVAKSNTNEAESSKPVRSPTYASIDDESELTGPFSPSTMIDATQAFDISYRVILVGDSGVGKTNIMSRWTKDTYSSESQSTITAECRNRFYKVDGSVISVQIWDTAGQERFRSLVSQYYRNADGVVVVYDMTRPQSYDSIKIWLDQVEQYAGSSDEKSIQYLLIGNKRDLVDERVIRTEDALALAKTKDMAFMETSALEGTNCMKALQIIIQDIHSIQSMKRKNVSGGSSTAPISISQGEKIEAQKEDSCC